MGCQNVNETTVSIPPTLQRSTASTISIDQVVNNNSKKLCGLQAKTSNVSRGVSSVNTKKNVLSFGSKVPDPSLRLAPDPVEQWRQNILPASNTENAGVLIWENCQDISNWCVDTFPTEYDFPIGESTTTKDTATRYLSSDASDLEKDLLTFPISIEDEPMPNLSPPNSQWSAVKRELQDDNLIAVTPGGGWLDLPALDLPESTSQVPVKNNARSTGIEIQDSIDFLRNLSVGTEKFDLLSYLYEEESGISVSATSSPLQSAKADLETERTINYRSDDSRSYSSCSTSVADPSETVDSSSRRQFRRVRKRKYEDDDDYIVQEPHRYRRESRLDTYRESREKNNEASRKSRMNKKAKEMEMVVEAERLDKENRILKMKVEQLDKLVTTMRRTLLKSALSRHR